MSARLLFVVPLSLVACGGKILEDPNRTTASSGPVAPLPSASSPPPPAAAPDPAPTVAPASQGTDDACSVLCARDERCATTIPAIPSSVDDPDDCLARCEKRLAGKCGADAWLLCFAARIDPNACTKIPDECVADYCAWATCAKQPVAWCS